MKTKFKGTKGEWVSYVDTYGEVCIDSRYDSVKIDLFGDSLKKVIANAQLMSAAPEMLEALLSIENDDNHIPEKIWELRNKAIEKALNVK